MLYDDGRKLTNGFGPFKHMEDDLNGPRYGSTVGLLLLKNSENRFSNMLVGGE